MSAGLSNWRSVLSDPGLPHALWVTFLVMFLSWAVQTPLALLIGVFLAGHQRYRAVLAVIYFVPLLLSSAAIAITYKALLDPNFGLGPGSAPGHPDPGLARQAGPGAGRGHLRGVVAVHPVPRPHLPGWGAADPASMYEAAAIDGAGRVRQFFSITLPQLKYTIITSSTLMVVGIADLLRPDLRAHRRWAR